MKTAQLYIIGILLFSSVALSGQSLQKTVSLSYNKQPLGSVLDDISKNYAVRFSYSKNYVPLKKRVSAEVKNTHLANALDHLFDGTGIVYAEMGGQVVLKVRAKRTTPTIGQIGSTLPKKVKPLRKTIQKEKQKREDGYLSMNLSPIKRKVVNQLPGGKRIREFDADIYHLPPIQDYDPEFAETRLAQVSLLPFLGTNALDSRKVVNNMSLNIFWGANGGVDGVEVGGFVNSIKKDVKGVQVAGLGNTVGGSTTGTQVSGLFNVNQGKLQGVQVGGLFNIAGPGDAVQAAGLFNVSTDDLSGVQVSGLFNTSLGDADGVQAACLFNTANGKTKTQVSSIFNVAGDVEVGQVSALLNRGKKVNGFQIGLINIADTISGTPIGLINIVKKGYNRVEFSASETMYGNFAMKFGAYSFYNILQIGARWDDVSFENNGEIQRGTYLSWSLGYGIGSAIRMGRSWILNMEAISMHVNETEFWTDELNLLNQFKLLFGVRTGKRTTFFVGPVGNLMISKRFNADTGRYGSEIMPYTLYDETKNGQNVKAWGGFTAGIRF